VSYGRTFGLCALSGGPVGSDGGTIADGSAPARYEAVPFPVKALKVLLKDLQALGGSRKGGRNDDPEIEEDDGVRRSSLLPDSVVVADDMKNDEWDDDDPLGDAGEDEFQFLSCEPLHLGRTYFRLISLAWLESGGGGDETQDDDEDLKSDPIAQIDLPVSVITASIAKGTPSAARRARSANPCSHT
jgi:hypothetical protein